MSERYSSLYISRLLLSISQSSYKLDKSHYYNNLHVHTCWHIFTVDALGQYLNTHVGLIFVQL